MKLAAYLTRSGETLFRHRSWLPLLLLPLFIGPLAVARYPFDSHALDLIWELACFLVSMGGLAIRIVTVGTAPRGTSGRNTRAQKARVLNTTGVYSLIRHPLYLGNYLIALGVSCFPCTWYLPLLVTLATVLYYERIALREEEYLAERFGDTFVDWAARTPAIIPNFRHYQRSAMPFRWRKALCGEYDGLVKITALFFALDVMQDLVITRRLTLDPVWAGLFAIGAVLFVVLRNMKTRGLLADQGIVTTGERNDEAVVENPANRVC